LTVLTSFLSAWSVFLVYCKPVNPNSKQRMKNKKRILIVSYFFWPDQTPRAFRAYELAKEFSRQNYHVTVITKKLKIDRIKNDPFDIIEIPVKLENVNEHIPSALFAMEVRKNIRRKKKKPLHTRFNAPAKIQFWKLFIWPSLRHYEFCYRGIKKLLNYRTQFIFDMTISIGLPIASHLLTYKLYNHGFNLGTLVADYGDPLTYNPDIDFSMINYLKEKKILSCFDFISIPIKKAVKSFTRLGIDPRKLRIIPQGFSFQTSNKIKYHLPQKSSKKSIFIYGGIFYKKIRNPENFFRALHLLKKQGKSFHFYIFTNIEHPYVKYLQKKYGKTLSDVVSFNDILMRGLFLGALEQADYGINFLNKSEYQEPSKLIDYALTGLKTFDIDMDLSPVEIVRKISSDDYYIPALDPVNDIRNIVSQYISLLSQKS